MNNLKIVILMLSSLLSFFGCKNRPREKTKIDEQINRSLEDFINRPIYPVLTIKILDTISNDELEQIIIDNLFKKLESTNSYEKQYELITSLSRGRQAVFSTWMLEAEVSNGGFNQYFYNFSSSGQYAEEARDGFKLIQANKHADLTQRAIDTLMKNYKELTKFRDGTLESFSKSYENNPLNQLDSEFYALKNAEDTPALRIKYIRDHLIEFIDN